MYKSAIEYDKPIYVGTSILDLSKFQMVKFHYEVIAENFDNYNLVYSDTDSFVYDIKCDDVYKWIQNNNNNHFDLSDDTFIKDNSNKDTLGTLNDELEGVPMNNVSSLNPNVYVFQTDEHKEVGKADGVSKVVVKKEINNGYYKYMLDTGDCINRDVYAIISMNHTVYTTKTNKTCLTPWYDKAVVIDNISCVPFGYKGNLI